MKEVTPPFRLYDFLAYVFPGLATLHALFLYSAGNREMLTGFLTTNAAFNYAMLVVASYVIGLFWSAVSRDVIRRLCWLVYNPRVEFLEPRKRRHSPICAGVRAMIQSELEKLLPAARLNPRDACVICRSYVAQNCPPSWDRRGFVSSLRAMATNFIGPVVIYAVFLFSHEQAGLGWLAVVVAIALLRKTITHDCIEWKEVYVSFLTHRMATKQASRRRSGDDEASSERIA